MRDSTHLPRVTPELLRGSSPLPLHSGPIRFSFEDEPEHERADLLQEFFARLRIPYEISHRSDAPLEFNLALHALPGLKMTSGRMNRSRSLRTRGEGGTNDIALIVNRKGPYVIAQDGDELVLGDGDAAFVSFGDPCSYTHRPPGDVLALSVPRAQFAPLVNGARQGAHRMLTNPRQAHEKISTIALDAGFADVSHFNRAFRQLYGDTPSGVRTGRTLN